MWTGRMMIGRIPTMSEGGPDPPLGIMLYGYAREEAVVIRDAISRGAGVPVDLVNASGKEDSTVSSILDSGGSGLFSDGESKILMFLGFTDDALGKAMDDLKVVPGIHRPIFCCLTEENMKWMLKDLIKDLRDEDRYWKERRGVPSAGPP